MIGLSATGATMRSSPAMSCLRVGNAHSPCVGCCGSNAVYGDGGNEYKCAPKDENMLMGSIADRACSEQAAPPNPDPSPPRASRAGGGEPKRSARGGWVAEPSA